MTDAVPTRSIRAVLLRGLGVVLGWHAVLVAGYVVWVLLQPTAHRGGGCEGLGWGCTPNPRDGAIIVGLVFGVPAVGATLLVASLVTAALAPRARSGRFIGTMATLGTWLLAIAGVFVWARTRS